MSPTTAPISNTLDLLLSIFGAISTVTCLSVIVLVHRTPRLQSTTNRLICFFLLSHLITSFALSWGNRTPSGGLTWQTPLAGAIPCYLQALLIQFAITATYAWDFLISLHILFVISSAGVVGKEDEERRLPFYHLYAWGIATLLTCALFVVQTLDESRGGLIIGDATLECW
ncbi:hypothetical protein HDU98_009124 [Podochytrium sp. JEL0797]|nr:hypothetical protein HDU98_009124 [Podochytrium sp. JEL0797]